MKKLGLLLLGIGINFMFALTANAQTLQEAIDLYKKEDFKMAVEIFKPLAEQANIEAQSFLGLMYYQGFGTPKNIKKALSYYLLSAKQGNTEAEFITNLISSELGDANSQFNLGMLCLSGKGYAPDYKEAIKWFYKAAEKENVNAQYNLGLMNLIGKGIPRDYKEAAKWLKKAAEHGNANAQHNLGFLYSKGYGVPLNYKEAVKWSKKAAEKGNPNAQYNMGLMYVNGYGVSQDFNEAVKWFSKAAKNGNINAQKNLEVLLQKKVVHEQ